MIESSLQQKDFIKNYTGDERLFIYNFMCSDAYCRYCGSPNIRYNGSWVDLKGKLHKNQSMCEKHLWIGQVNKSIGITIHGDKFAKKV